MVLVGHRAARPAHPDAVRRKRLDLRISRTCVPALLMALLLAGCGGTEATPETEETPTPTATTSPSGSPTPSPETSEPSEPSEPSDEATPEGLVVEIGFSGDTVTPNGERVQAEVGETITLRIDSDRAGELHVHSTPEQEIEFRTGRSRHELVIDQPGVVDVEDHDSGRVLLQLQVS